ncbi:hypothetical protein LSH36_2444g00000 [Paralvinella palmiformis]|uniref:Uncharacterized protein n=1 Tax=Paralvinella palmiformis TaxID=53620 RepID=A0AAD9IQM2_9ANNE|nr:hypothetical protein LSH36_2444g00000 [Paralvinella palmiformis]
MRLLLFSLFSLLLYTLVSSHPMTHARGVRIRKQTPEVKPEYPERQPPESDASISPMKPSSDDSENIEDWLEMIEKKCGFDVEMEDNIEKVNPDDVRRILKSAAWTIEEIAKDFSRHAKDIDTLEATMADQSLPEVVSSHIDVLHKFGYLVESAAQKGICDFISMQMLLDRMQFMGNDGFGESRCSNAYGMVFRPDKKVRKQNKLEWIRNFGDAIRKDMYCIVDDINALSKRMTSLKDLAGRQIPFFDLFCIG